jgi:hypothetical protein
LIGWSPRAWLAFRLGCDAEDLQLLSVSEQPERVTARYRVAGHDEVTVVALIGGERHRLVINHRGRDAVADVHSGRPIIW